MSVSGPCAQEAVEAEAHDDDDRQNEEFHGCSLLGPGVVAVDDAHDPGACMQRIPEAKNMQCNS
jgi:hypothetical protein